MLNCFLEDPLLPRSSVFLDISIEPSLLILSGGTIKEELVSGIHGGLRKEPTSHFACDIKLPTRGINSFRFSYFWRHFIGFPTFTHLFGNPNFTFFFTKEFGFFFGGKRGSI